MVASSCILHRLADLQNQCKGIIAGAFCPNNADKLIQPNGFPQLTYSKIDRLPQYLFGAKNLPNLCSSSQDDASRTIAKQGHGDNHLIYECTPNRRNVIPTLNKVQGIETVNRERDRKGMHTISAKITKISYRAFIKDVDLKLLITVGRIEA